MTTLVLSSILLVGCSASTPAPSSQVAEAPKNKERPEWFYDVPNEEDGKLFFVGLSDVNISEKDARIDALRDVTNNVVQYLGTLVQFKFEELSVSYGLSSEMVDPTKSSQQFQKQIATNLARRIKEKNRHIEREMLNGKLGYKYLILAEIPKSAIDNSFKKTMDKSIDHQQKEAENASTEKAKKQAEQSIEMFRKMKKEGLMD